nr:hypothetical protein [Tanacetum cinerariifolium]
MEVKSVFLYGTIEEDVYVCQPLGFEDPDYPNKVYKVVKALYGLHQAPRVDDIIFGSTIKELCKAFEKLMNDKFQKNVKSASTPIETEKPLLKDPDGEDLDVHIYSESPLLGVNTPRCDEDSIELKELMVFIATATVKKVNDDVQLCTLIDGKKVVVFEAIIRRDLYLDDADGVECYPIDEIFEELARMGYEKPPPKLTFYKAMVRNVDSPSKFLMYLLFLQVVLDHQVDDMTTHNTRYTSPALTQKVFANMKRVRKGFSGVETPLFDSMLVVAMDVESQERLNQEDVNAASKGVSVVSAPELVSATEPIVFNDEDVTMTMAQTLIKLKAEKARILDEEIAQKLHDEKLDEKEENIDWSAMADQVQEKHLDSIKKYQNLKKKPISIAQAKKSMIIYLKNMAGYKMEFFKEMTYDKKFSSAEPSEDKEKALWVKLKSDCGVHHVSSTRGHDIFMLTEKDYPLTNAVMILMLSGKLQVKEDNEMDRDLVMKIFIEANKPRSKSLDTSS